MFLGFVAVRFHLPKVEPARSVSKEESPRAPELLKVYQFPDIEESACN